MSKSLKKTGVGFKILFNVDDDKHTAPVLTHYKPRAGDSGVPTLTGAGKLGTDFYSSIFNNPTVATKN